MYSQSIRITTSNPLYPFKLPINRKQSRNQRSLYQDPTAQKIEDNSRKSAITVKIITIIEFPRARPSGGVINS